MRDILSLFLQVTLGQRRGISAIDAQQMNLLYKSQCGGGGGGAGGGGGGCYNIFSIFHNSLCY